MKKVVLLLAMVSVLACACSRSNSNDSNGSIIGSTLNEGITDEEYCNQLQSYGAADAFIDRSNGVFSYGVVEGAVTGNPDDVARLMYEDAYESGIRGISECRVVELPKGKMLGRYKP